VSTCGLFAFVFLPPSIVTAKDKKSPCDKPREIASQPQLSKEDQVKAHKIRAQGMVNITITEDGDVVNAQVVRASSTEAVPLLLAFAKSAKFKPRPECGPTHSAINYTLVNQ
jgi:outer membrane biosynthesis protein TonB